MPRYARAPYEQLVCSGGGTRCCWQGGWLHVVRDEIGLEPARVIGVSGGAATAAGFIGRNGAALVDRMCEAFDRLDSNLDYHAIGDAGLSPHQSLYQAIIHEVFDPATMQDIGQGSVFQILVGHPPSGAFPKLSGSAATLAYEAELHLVGSPHFNWAEKVGVTATRIDARQAARDGTLADLICAAAVIPPIFEPPLWDGQPVIDGGMVDQAPMPAPDEGASLILLTRNYANVPEIDGRHYVEPSKEVDADKLDFTDPAKIRRTWEQGEADGRAFLDRYNSD